MNILNRFFKPHNVEKFLKAKKIDIDTKLMLKRLSQNNHFLHDSLEKTPKKDLLEITKEYSKCPNEYDKVLRGSVKYGLNGLTDEPLPIFNRELFEEHKSAAKLFSPSSIVREFASMLNIFHEAGAKKVVVKKPSLESKSSSLIFLKLSAHIDRETINYTHKFFDINSYVSRMLNASDNKKVYVYIA